MSKKFLRQEAHFKKRIALNWRKPKGRHSKLREKRRGLHKMPSLGYKKKESERVKPLIINNLKDLELLKKGAKVTIASKVGKRKKILIIEACTKKGLIITNHKKVEEKLKALKAKAKAKPKKKEVKAKPQTVPKTTKKKVVVKKASSKDSKKVVKKVGDDK